MSDTIIQVESLKNYLGGQWVHEDVSFDVKRGEIFAIIGGSGSGKTTLLRALLTLLKPQGGNITIMGENILDISISKLKKLSRRWGVLFQHNALFSNMNVLENIMFPMQSFTTLPLHFMKELAMLKIALVGLSKETAFKFPNELSGGMQKRAATARAIAMDPELLFLDEPTSGLDPYSARQFNELILFLRQALNLTLVIVSHDVQLLKDAADKIIFIGEGRVLACGDYETLSKDKHPAVADYFSKV